MADRGALCGLPEDVLNKGIIQASASGSLTQTRKARLVCQPFCVFASLLVRTLACGSSCDISKRAWRSFPNAEGLVIEFSDLDDHPQLGDLIDRVPAGRLKRFAVLFATRRFASRGGDLSLWWHLVETPWSARAAAAIRNAESTKLLREVSIEGPIKAMDAAGLINCLPHLEVARLLVGSSEGDGVWTFQGGRQLRVLELGSRGAQLHVDITCLAACTLLEELTLHSAQFSDWPALASLAKLRFLDLSDSDAPEPTEHVMKPLAQLISLQHLVACGWELEPLDWQLLAGMQQLQQLECLSLKLLLTSPSSSTITRFTGELEYYDQELDEELHPAQVPAGAFAGHLPELQEASCCLTSNNSWNYMDIACMMAGASKLRVLRFESRSDFEHIWDVSWPAGTLSSMPCLEEFELGNTEIVDVDGLLTDAAGCSKLRSFALECLDSSRLLLKYSGAGLQALAAGACSSSLERVVVQTRDVAVPVEAALPVLQLPQLQQVELSLSWSGPGLPPDEKEQWAATVCAELGAQLHAAGLGSVLQCAGPLHAPKRFSVWRPVICPLEFVVDGTALVCCAVRETQRQQAAK